METKFMQLSDLEERQRKLRKQLTETEDAIKEAKDEKRSMELEALKPLAIRAHNILCGWNHTDGCGWLYETNNPDGRAEPIHNWTGKYSAHAAWLERVEKWLEHQRFGVTMTIEKLSEILDHIEAGKKLHSDYLYLVREVIRER